MGDSEGVPEDRVSYLGQTAPYLGLGSPNLLTVPAYKDLGQEMGDSLAKLRTLLTLGVLSGPHNWTPLTRAPLGGAYL